MPGLQDLNFKENPFNKVFNQQEQAPARPQQAPDAEVSKIPLQRGGGMGRGMGPGANGAGMPSGAGASTPNQFNRGENPDNLKPLIGATQSIEKFITESTNKKAIMMARGLVTALSRLMAITQAENAPADNDQSLPHQPSITLPTR